MRTTRFSRPAVSLSNKPIAPVPQTSSVPQRFEPAPHLFFVFLGIALAGGLGNQPHLSDSGDYPVRALLRKLEVSLNHAIRRKRLFIRIIDYGEVFYLTGQRLLVEPFYISLGQN